jgi:hypothetical protein
MIVETLGNVRTLVFIYSNQTLFQFLQKERSVCDDKCYRTNCPTQIPHLYIHAFSVDRNIKPKLAK